MKALELFDAVRIVGLFEGRTEVPAHYSQSGTTHIRVGDIGVVIGPWRGEQYRVEAAGSDGRISWQHHFDREQLEVLPSTGAPFSRRRINEHWACQLALGKELLERDQRDGALRFARKVMSYARVNVELLLERLDRSGYRFANEQGPLRTPEPHLAEAFETLGSRGFHVPIAIQAWFLEVGCVDFTGTHPAWPKSAYTGLCDNGSRSEPWYTDPLFLWFDVVCGGGGNSAA